MKSLLGIVSRAEYSCRLIFSSGFTDFKRYEYRAVVTNKLQVDYKEHFALTCALPTTYATKIIIVRSSHRESQARFEKKVSL